MSVQVPQNPKTCSHHRRYAVVMKPNVDIKIVPATEENTKEIGDFFVKYFFPDEPLNSSLQRCPTIDEIPFLDVLKERLSFMAVNEMADPQDRLAGVVVNKEMTLEKKKNQRPTDDKKTLKIRKILNELDEKFKIWDTVNNESHFNILAVSVNSKYRGLGIGQRLLEESLKLAKARNFNYASIECSSFYSARFAYQMGFQLLGEIHYDQYLDENQEQVFKVKNPHVSLKKMYKVL